MLGPSSEDQLRQLSGHYGQIGGLASLQGIGQAMIGQAVSYPDLPYRPTPLSTIERMQIEVNDWLKDWDK